MRQSIVLVLSSACALAAFAEDEPHEFTLSQRVKAANLIVVGKVGGPLTVSKHSNLSDITVDQVLFGSPPTNKTLVAWYATTALLIPTIASTRHAIRQENRYICFLAREDGRQDRPDAYVVNAIGNRRYAHNAFELFTPAMIEEVKMLIAARNQKR